MSHVETITFDKGLNSKKAPLLLEEGELVTAQGMSADHPGLIEPRSSKQKASATQIGTINGLHRNVNRVIVVDDKSVRSKWDLDGYCDQYIPPDGDFTAVGSLASSNRPLFCDHEEFTFIVTGNDKKVFVDGYLYDWDIPAPTTAPSGAAGASGNPSGTYSLYYTYLIYFPNGTAVETGPSPAGEVTVSSQKISWSNIRPCTYSGTGLTIHRKLYRYSTTLIETYYVDTITDNTTTTYTDNFTDAELEISDILETTYYITPPDDPSCAVSHLQRVFVLAQNYLYPSETYLPFNFDSTEVIQVTQLGDDLMGGVVWGDQLFLPTKSRWYRLHGSNSETWMIRKTFAHSGCINKHTLKATRYGILAQWYDGIYLFDGSVSRNITEKKIEQSVFTGISDIDACYSEWDGRKYFFHYPTSGSTISKRLVIDMTSYPDFAVYLEDFIPTAHFYHVISGINYYGYDGYHYEEGGTDTVSLSMKTGDRAAKNILQQKQLEYFYYDINTAGKDVVVTIYLDDSAVFTKTLNTTARTKDRVLLPRKDGYRFSIALSSSDARGVVIYEPWAISVNPTGV